MWNKLDMASLFVRQRAAVWRESLRRWLLMRWRERRHLLLGS